MNEYITTEKFCHHDASKDEMYFTKCDDQEKTLSGKSTCYVEPSKEGVYELADGIFDGGTYGNLEESAIEYNKEASMTTWSKRKKAAVALGVIILVLVICSISYGTLDGAHDEVKNHQIRSSKGKINIFIKCLEFFFIENLN